MTIIAPNINSFGSYRSVTQMLNTIEISWTVSEMRPAERQWANITIMSSYYTSLRAVIYSWCSY